MISFYRMFIDPNKRSDPALVVNVPGAHRGLVSVTPGLTCYIIPRWPQTAFGYLMNAAAASSSDTLETTAINEMYSFVFQPYDK